MAISAVETRLANRGREDTPDPAPAHELAGRARLSKLAI